MKLNKTSELDIFKNPPDDWPSQDNFVNPHKATQEQYLAFEELISNKPSETEIENYLKQNKEILALIMFLFSTGHHASWVFPKQSIRVPSNGLSGKIPDYVLAGANSDGVSWFVLELKGANHKAFNNKGKNVYLSSVANKGICQLAEYIDVSTRSQAYLRDEIKLKGYREPQGILLIGTEEETEDKHVCDFKGAWNRMFSKTKIYSYNRLLRTIKPHIKTANK